MYCTYVPLSKKDGKFYVGYTNNLQARLESRNKGRVDSTSYRRPFVLIYCEACINQKDAIRREKYFKTYLGKMFLKNRLKSYLTGSMPRSRD
ncbi:GIY-YIG nuclease family protein [Candidatus Saccharibacteria bacterium]|nr:GIY-YIG nuclease family protein [Candidatus Saccharibacteria bacterium]